MTTTLGTTTTPTMTTMMMTTTSRPPRRRVSIRARVLASMILLVGFALAVSGAAIYVYERQELNARLDDSLTRTVEEFRVLAETGIVRDVKVGRERLWELEPRRIEEARRSLDMIGQQWDNALLRLKAMVEGEE